MNRWIRSLLLAGCALGFAGATLGQTLVREAPADVQPGRLRITQPPEVQLDGRPDRLSPGARIRNPQNLVVLSGSLAGQDVPVIYRRDAVGLLHELWLLTEAEYTRLGGRTPGRDEASLREFNNVLAQIFGARGASR